MKFNWFRREQREADLDAEIRSHLDEAIRDRIARGEAPDEARAHALREFGNVGLVKEVTREMWGWASLERLMQDLRFGLRMLRKNPGFTLIAVITLALGIGGSATIFSLINAVLLRPLPVERPAELVSVYTATAGGLAWGSTSHSDFLDYRAQQADLTELAAWNFTLVSSGNGAQHEIIPALLTSGNYFAALGVKPALGRAFLPEEESQLRPVAVLSYDFWQRSFGAQADAIGRELRFNGRPFTIVGIAPKEFTGTLTGIKPDVWVPLNLQPQLSPAPGQPLTDRHDRWLNLIGRLKPGVNAARLETALSAHAAQLDQSFPDTREQRTRRISVTPASTLPPGFRQAAWLFTALLLAIAGLGLLIACANVANLSLSRASARRHEMGIRQSLGATRMRLLRQVLTESVLLALLGGLAGLLVAFWGKGLIHLFSPPTPVPIAFDLSLDWRVLGFAFVLSLVAGMIFGAAPAWQAARINLVASLKKEADLTGRGRRRWLAARDVFVVTQLTLSILLLTLAGLCVRSLQHLKRGETGFDATNVAMMWLDLGMLGYQETRGREFYQRLVERIRALPGVTSVSLVNNVPLGLAFSEIPISLPDRESPPDGTLITAGNYIVEPDYFDTLKLPLLRGRNFTSRDAAQSPKVILVNEAMARRYWPNEEPLGKRIQLTPRPGSQYEYFEVVGVVRDHKHVSLLEDPRPCFYRPFAQSWQAQMNLLVRANHDPQPLLTALRREAQTLEENVPILALRSLRENMIYSLLPWQMAATLAGLAGGLALLLAALGVYGVVSFAVSQRLPEFGLRLALGAQPGNIFTLVLKQAAKLTLLSLSLGLVLALIVARALAAFLYGISFADPITFVLVPLLLTGVALLACWIPARRAAKVDPMIALRCD